MKALAQRDRLVVAIVCVARVVPIFDAMCEHDGRALHDGVALVRRVVAGERVGHDQLWPAIRALADMPQDTEEQAGSVSWLMASVADAVNQLLFAADDLTQHPESCAANAVRRAFEAVFRFEDLEDGDGAWTRAEEEWHERVLAAVERGDPPEREAAPGEWLERLRAEWS